MTKWLRPEIPTPADERSARSARFAAVAVLPDSQMTDQKALQNIAAIAEWVREEAPGAQPDCGSIIHRLHELTGSVDVEALDDGAALDLFSDVLGALEAADVAVFSGQP